MFLFSCELGLQLVRDELCPQSHAGVLIPWWPCWEMESLQRSSGHSKVARWAVIQCDLGPYNMRTSGHRDRHAQREDDMKTQGEGSVYKPRGGFRGTSPSKRLAFGLLAQNSEKMNSCCLNHLIRGTLLRQPQQTKTIALQPSLRRHWTQPSFCPCSGPSPRRRLDLLHLFQALLLCIMCQDLAAL